MKVYKAKSAVSINIVLASGKSKHIGFQPLTTGGSVYYSENEAEIEAIERHPKFGKLFKEETPRVRKPKTNKTPITKAAPTEVAVACEDDAKNILCDRYGYSRTKLKRVEQIKKAAAEVNIVFTGI